MMNVGDEIWEEGEVKVQKSLLTRGSRHSVSVNNSILSPFGPRWLFLP